MQQLIHWMSEAPAKRFRMEHKGKIEVGYDADLILVDTDTYKTIDKREFYSKGKNTPFDGISCTGWIEKTFIMGECVYDAKKGMRK